MLDTLILYVIAGLILWWMLRIALAVVGFGAGGAALVAIVLVGSWAVKHSSLPDGVIIALGVTVMLALLAFIVVILIALIRFLMDEIRGPRKGPRDRKGS